jgi:hypothetical protein
MLSGGNGRKRERNQYFEGVTVITLVMCSRWDVVGVLDEEE